MPICFKPGKSFPYVLACDRKDDKPATFMLAALNGHEVQDFAQLFDDLKAKAKEMTGRDGIKYVYDAIRSGVNGKPIVTNWSDLIGEDGKPITFDLAKLEAVLAFSEANEIIAATIGGISKADRGK